jgi:hypothetical protein
MTKQDFVEGCGVTLLQAGDEGSVWVGRVQGLSVRSRIGRSPAGHHTVGSRPGIRIDGSTGSPQSRGTVSEPRDAYTYTLEPAADVPAAVRNGARITKTGATP